MGARSKTMLQVSEPRAAFGARIRPDSGSSARSSRKIAITPAGPFSWTAATDVLANFPPLQRHWRGTSDVVRLAFPLDGDYTPVAVALRYADGSLQGEVAGTSDLEAVVAQVARIFSL